ncbi:MAG TPA: DNA methyltransferase [Candidatus Bathyarchaeia archaeon]|nr:DNA methyltransferase [Candidatus Bathyarchaeia archaeon]
MNHLDGKEWIKFTKSWFKHNPPRRDREKLVHPAGFPETLVQEFIEFFTKRRMWVLDPFLGSGSTLLAARISGRNGVGVDVNNRYISISKRRLATVPRSKQTTQLVLHGDSRRLGELLKENRISDFDFCITSPPYWDQLKRASLRQRERAQKGWDTVYSRNPDDIGNISNYEKFLDAEEVIFDQVHETVRPGGYLVVITNNVFFDGRVYPLAFDTFNRLAKRWIPKDEKIWLHDDKRLLPLGIYNAWVGNRSHHYCLIFRKKILAE